MVAFVWKLNEWVAMCGHGLFMVDTSYCSMYRRANSLTCEPVDCCVLKQTPGTSVKVIPLPLSKYATRVICTTWYQQQQQQHYMELMTIRKNQLYNQNISQSPRWRKFVCSPHDVLASFLVRCWPLDLHKASDLYIVNVFQFAFNKNITTPLQSILLSPAALCREKSENVMPTWSCSYVQPLWFPALCFPPLWVPQPRRHLNFFSGQPALAKWFCFSPLPQAKNGWKFG